MCEHCWDGLMSDNGIRPAGQEPAPAPGPQPNPVVTAGCALIAVILGLATLACAVGLLVRAVQWAWPG